MKLDSQSFQPQNNATEFQVHFGFGIEAEYFLAKAGSLQPLWHRDMSFAKLNKALESVSLEGVPNLEGLYPNPPHQKLMPYVVEGYHVHDRELRPIDILPKGVEIRTPRCTTIAECLDIFLLLHRRMQQALRSEGLIAIALSHHPLEEHFEGPQENRDHDYWLWAKQAMVTYGPDINISLPQVLRKRLDLGELDAKVDYYAPALTALSLASPFYQGELWRPAGRKEYGRAVRTFKRSLVAPAIEIHPEQEWRLEYKTFEMSCSLNDYHCFFLLWLELLLDEKLKGRATRHSRIYDLGSVSQTGLQEDLIRKRANEVLEGAFHTLPRWGFSPAPLDSMIARVDAQKCPADQMIEQYLSHRSLTTIFASRTELVPEAKRAPFKEQIAQVAAS